MKTSTILSYLPRGAIPVFIPVHADFVFHRLQLSVIINQRIVERYGNYLHLWSRRVDEIFPRRKLFIVDFKFRRVSFDDMYNKVKENHKKTSPQTS